MAEHQSFSHPEAHGDTQLEDASATGTHNEGDASVGVDDCRPMADSANSTVQAGITHSSTALSGSRAHQVGGVISALVSDQSGSVPGVSAIESPEVPPQAPQQSAPFSGVFISALSGRDAIGPILRDQEDARRALHIISTELSAASSDAEAQFAEMAPAFRRAAVVARELATDLENISARVRLLRATLRDKAEAQRKQGSEQLPKTRK